MKTEEEKAERKRLLARLNYWKNPSGQRKANAKYREKHADRIKAYKTDYAKKNVVRRKAHRAVYLALKSGDLVRPLACSVCRRTDQKTHAHHEDIEKPLEIAWLCPKCHKEADKILRQKTA